MKKTFDRGDIVSLVLSSSAAEHLCTALVLSAKKFNTLGLTVIAPISNGNDVARYAGFAVSLPTNGSVTRGFVLANMVRTVDLNEHGAKLVETVDQRIVSEVVGRIIPVISG